MRDLADAAVGQVQQLGDHGGGGEGGSGGADSGGGGGRGGGVEAGVAAERELEGGVGERPADLALVLVLDGDPQVRGGLLVHRRIRVVEAEQAHVGLLEQIGRAHV